MSFRPYQPPDSSQELSSYLSAEHIGPTGPLRLINQCPLQEELQRLAPGYLSNELIDAVYQKLSSRHEINNGVPVPPPRQDALRYDRDVHVYDHKVEYTIPVPRYQQESKNRLFQKVIPLFSNGSKGMLNLVWKEQGRNIDNRNGYLADDLLTYLMVYGIGEDFYKNLDEQLADSFRLGQCPQGRTIRFISLVNAFVPS